MNNPTKQFLVTTALSILALGFASGLIPQYKDDGAKPEPTPYVWCVPQPPTKTCLIRV